MESTSTELTVRQPDALMPTLGIKPFMEAIDEIRQLIGRAMRPNIDYGAIPGTDQTKKVLLQPGAQKALMYFNCYPEHQVTFLELPGGHLEVRVVTSIIRRSDKDKVAEGVGSCSTMESKYRWRNAERSCPECGKASIIKGNPKYAPKGDDGEPLFGYDKGGWLCWKKKGGCGATFPDAELRIAGQTVGKVENENLADVRNTVLKIAKKRADVDGAISLSCLGELFTADVEANEGEEPAEEELSEAAKFAQMSALLTGQFKQRLRATPMNPDLLAAIHADMAREWPHIGANGQKELTNLYTSVKAGLAPQAVAEQPTPNIDKHGQMSEGASQALYVTRRNKLRDAKTIEEWEAVKKVIEGDLDEIGEGNFESLMEYADQRGKELLSAKAAKPKGGKP